jgi:xylulokinase
VDLTHISPQPILFLPHLAGRRFPVADAAASGGFLGLRASHTSADMWAAVLQGIAFTFREVFEAMTGTGNRPARIRLGGGAAQTPGFANLLATVLNTPVERIAGSDLTCEGAAMLAAKWLNWPSRDIPTGEILLPEPELVEGFSEMFPLYLALNSAVAPIAQRLHGIAT